MLTDHDYYADRAAKAQRFADRATAPEVRKLHLQMVERYRRLAAEMVPERATNDDVQQAVDRIAEALSLLDSAGRSAEAAYLSTVLEMLVTEPDAGSAEA